MVGWFALYESGVHATLLGVAFGLITPAYALLPASLYLQAAIALVNEVADNCAGGMTADEHEENDQVLREVRDRDSPWRPSHPWTGTRPG